MKSIAATRTQLRIQEAAMSLFAETGAERLGVSELANAAGLARGTIYNNLDNPSVTVADLAPIVRGQMEAELAERLDRIEPPLQRIAIILHAHAEKAHHDPVWSAFALRFGYAVSEMRDFWRDIPRREIAQAAKLGAIAPQPASPGFAAAMMGGVCLSMITIIRNGSRGWREGAMESASLFLRSIGARPEEIRSAAAPQDERPARGLKPADMATRTNSAGHHRKGHDRLKRAAP